MFWQREVLRDGVSMTFNQTYELDLPKSGQLGSLVCYVRSQQNGAPFLTAVKWRLIDYISKIELIAEGSEIIKSYDGRQALACAYNDDGVLPPGKWETYSNNNHRQFIPIHLGRYLMDKRHFLDLSRFNQVTLKVTNDATATQFNTDIKITVIAYWLREAAAAARGYFREEVWKTWNPVAAGWEYNDLPTLLPIRRILLRARPAVDTADAKNNSTMYGLMSDIEFNLRTGQVRAFRGNLFDLSFLTAIEQKRYAEVMTGLDRTDEYGYDVGIGYVINGVKSAGTSTASPVAGAGSKGAAGVNDSAQEVQMRVADEPLEGIFKGLGFGHCVPLFESVEPDSTDLLDPEKDKVVQVNTLCASGTTVTGTDRNAENAIVLSRLVT